MAPRPETASTSTSPGRRSPSPPGGAGAGAGAVYFAVDDAEAVHREWASSGVGQTSDLFDPGYGVWEAAHTDPDGNLIRFGAPIP